MLENGLISQRAIKCNTFWGRFCPFCLIPKPPHIGAAKELGVINIIMREVASSCEICDHQIASFCNCK